MLLSESNAGVLKPLTSLQTAVLFVVFNRPDTTAQVFEAIRKAKPPRLYVAADGPRPDKNGEVEKVARVREIATAVDWPCEVKTLFREENLGCKYAVSGAITWFFEQEEQGIILEDDCLPSQSFFWFCEDILERFKSDNRVMSICGVNIVDCIDSQESYFFSIYALMWGWATWRRAWKSYKPDLKSWSNHKNMRLIGKNIVLTKIQKLTWVNILSKTYRGKIDTWDYQWIYTCWLNSGLTIAPTVNLICNIGFSEDATHTKIFNPILSSLVAKDIAFPLKHPYTMQINRSVDHFISRHWFRANWRNYIKVMMLEFLGMPQLNEFSRKLLNMWKEAKLSGAEKS